ncbi:MAG: hypothetical protein ACYSW4_06785 [Planctomycetota bacterium]|jgi:hypothetical protein
MNEFIEQNRRPLRFCCLAVQVFGWALALAGVVWFIRFLSRPFQPSLDGIGGIRFILYGVSCFVFDFFFVGLASVILAQLARYFFEGESKPGLFLRCGDKILYSFAAIGIFWAVFGYGTSIRLIENADLRFLYSQALLLPTIAKVLILVALGQILRRILPIIEESKTLV